MLFADSELLGTFKGFSERGLEFAADIVAPYSSSMLDKPQLGQFLLIELGSPEEAALGRITRFVPSGLLASAEGEDYINTMQRRNQLVPEDLKQQRLKYHVQVKLLGAVQNKDGKVIYIPSQRRLPHLGARVALPSAEVLKELCRLSRGETDLGDYVLGEFVFCGSDVQHGNEALRSLSPKLSVTFNIKNLVSRRSVVFARAGYGKSNLIKYLLSELYREQPKTENESPVGTLVFDPDGEYFWPDQANNRPGLCDVPHLRDSLAVFTNRKPRSRYYDSWKLGSVKLDIRDLRPSDVISIAVPSEKQANQNVIKLRGLHDEQWRDLVDLFAESHLQADDDKISELLGYGKGKARENMAEISGAKNNMNAVVRTLHDPNSRLLAGTLQSLKEGKIVVIDISLLSSAAGNLLAGLILRKIFSHNQEHFTGGGSIIPVIAVVEEAQSVLGRSLNDASPFVEWVKEGRKYDLGAILITQQPGSLSGEIMSQADNWFSFHLLSEGDAGVLGKYNSHFSDDILAHLIAEPIIGNCYMWSAPLQPFVLPVRIKSFEVLYSYNIRKNPDEPAIQDLSTSYIYKAIDTNIYEIAGKVKEKLAKEKTHYSFPRIIDGKDAFGIKSGRLFFLIQECIPEGEIQTPDQLKIPIMRAIFGENFKSEMKDGLEYYCATADAWKTCLGIDPSNS